VSRSLLILGCSLRKQQLPELLPAIDRYDGVFFQVLKKFLRESEEKALDVLIISARFGLIEVKTPIPDYDQRMTKQRAAELAPSVIAKLRSCLHKSHYKEIFINIGKDYEATLGGIRELNGAIWAAGSIGKRASRMKKWLRSSIHEGAPQ
jgi:hypothetical protein